MPRVVIIGAGPAGVYAMQTFANTLKPADNTEIIVLEKNKFFYHTFGAARALTEESYAKKMFIPFDNVVPERARSFVKFVRAIATGISSNPNKVLYQHIDDDDKPANEADVVEYDYLIVATGSSYSVPIKHDSNNYARAYTEGKIKEVRENIARAEKILVVGGGASGCETAADIAAHFPEKQVTIVSSQPELVMSDDVQDTFRDRLLESLNKLNVHVILGERLEERLPGNTFTRRTLRTDKGTTIESDIQLLCAGFEPVVDLVEGMDASLIDDKGAIKVNDLMQLDHPMYHHIFALGDAVNHKTPKLGYYAAKQAEHVAKELIAVIRGYQDTVTKPFPAVTVEMLVVPLGPNGGVSQLPIFGGWVFGDWVSSIFKSRDMMAGRMWQFLGAKVPN